MEIIIGIVLAIATGLAAWLLVKSTPVRRVLAIIAATFLFSGIALSENDVNYLFFVGLAVIVVLGWEMFVEAFFELFNIKPKAKPALVVEPQESAE
ncbi:MAG: hypothetical protein WAQ27_06230 [Candidatus Microsaccharimonas sp.]